MTKVTFLSFILAAVLVLTIKQVFISILNFFPYEHHTNSTFLHQLQLDENSISFLHHQLISLCFLHFVPSIPFLCKRSYDLR